MRTRPAPVDATVDVGGHPVGLTVEGDGPPLVLLHGIGRDRADWCAVQPLLAQRFTTYAFDLEGFGLSSGWGSAVSLASMAAVVRAALASVGERRPIRIVGNSMGGAVAMRVVADDPAAVEGVVLISPAGFGRDAAFGLRLLTLPVVGPVLLALDGVFATLARFDHDPRSRELALAAAHRLRDPALRRRYLQVIHDLGAWSGIREGWRTEVLAALAAAQVPTLVVWGDRDTVLPYAHLAAVQEAVPHASVLPLPGLGHMPQLEQPERIAGLIEDFLVGPPPLAGGGRQKVAADRSASSEESPASFS